ncbi:hypothetical protein RKD52_000304 [Metabacillus sp. SLBN-84]
MRNRLGQLRRAEKDPAEKAGFAFFDGAVLAEELGDAAGHHEMRNHIGLPHKKKQPEIEQTISIPGCLQRGCVLLYDKVRFFA